MSRDERNIEPIVVCHGLFGSLSDDFLLKPFGDYRVLTPDLLGYGNCASTAIDSPSLIEQVDHVLSFMDQNGVEQANVVGHSVGVAVAALLAIHYPDRVRSLISVEGNMTPPDAFWSAGLASKSIEEVQELVNGYRSDVSAWIAAAGVDASPESLRVATAWLDNQPASTLKAQASAVVEATSDASGFLELLRAQLNNGLVLHLISGAHSRGDWHVPADIEASAKSVTLIPNCGHLMMLDSPVSYAQSIIDAVTWLYKNESN